jgi:hypothetical protein
MAEGSPSARRDQERTSVDLLLNAMATHLRRYVVLRPDRAHARRGER